MYVFEQLNSLKVLLEKHSVKILMMDFDGTLTPIVEFPENAFLSQKMEDLIKRISKKKGIYLAIISGRSLEDLKSRIAIDNIIFSGNHGLQSDIWGKQQTVSLSDKKIRILRRVRLKLENLAKQFKGVIVEDKGLTISFHYRLSDKDKLRNIKSLLNTTLNPFIETGLISVLDGKMALNVLPKTSFDKGSFASSIIKAVNAKTKIMPLAIFIGDDITDEDVFKQIENGITIKVGKNIKSEASYYLKDPDEVFKFLRWLDANF